MAANMELKMFASKVKNPWWAVEGENYVFPDATNEELFQASKADFPVSLIPIFDADGKEIPGYFVLRNEVTGTALRMAKGRFQPVQSEFLFSQLDKLGNITEIGAIGGGEKVFFSLEAGQFTIGEGNTHISHVNAVLPHDGTMKVTLGLGNFRIECENTFNTWKRSLKNSEILATKQTAGAEMKIDGWIKAFQEMQKENLNLQEKFQTLARMKFGPDKQAEIISKIYGEKESTRSQNNMARLAQIIGDNASNIPPAQRGTGYDLFNGITYFTSHESSIKKGTSRLEAAMFGTAQKFAEDALNFILDQKPDDFLELNEGNLARSLSL